MENLTFHQRYFRSVNDLIAISRWIDNYSPNKERSFEAQTWGRIAKVTEEIGEVTAAMVGWTNQNPRKGQTHTKSDVIKELLDTALTALAAVEHLNANSGQSMNMLRDHIHTVAERAGLSNDQGCTRCGIPHSSVFPCVDHQ